MRFTCSDWCRAFYVYPPIYSRGFKPKVSNPVQASTSNRDQHLDSQSQDVYLEHMPSLGQWSRQNSMENPFGDGAEPTDDILLKRLVHFPPPSIADTDDEYSDDYDWSGEEDLGEEAAMFKKKSVESDKKKWTFKRIMTLLFTSLVGSTFLAAVLVAVGIVIHLDWDDTSTEHLKKLNIEAWLFWTAANVVISWYLALLVDLVPIIVRYFIMATWGHVSEAVKTRLEFYAMAKNNFKPVLYAANCWASWVIIFGHIYDLYNPGNSNDSRSPYTKRVFQVIEFVFFIALIVCAQKMFLNAIAFTFHQTTSKDRLNALAEALPVIESLRDYQPRISSQAGLRAGRRAAPPVFTNPFLDKYQSDCASDDGTLGDTDDADFSRISRRKPKDRGKRNSDGWFHRWFRSKYRQPSNRTIESAESGASSPLYSGATTPSVPILRYNVAETPSRRNSAEAGMDAGETIAQAARVLKSTVLHDARNIAGDDENETAPLSKGTGTVDEAKHLARSIYAKVRPPHCGRTFLVPSDFYPVFPTHKQAERAFRVFDKDNNGDISRGEVKSTLVKVYKERRLLTRSMRDVDAALKMLDQIFSLFAMAVLLLISLRVFAVDVGHGLMNLYSIAIAASFVFKGSAAKAFDAIMFLFVTHPFDTGDRCFIDKENLVVKKMTLFATVFTRVDGTETYYFNSQLFTKFIANKMFENCTLQIGWETPLEKLDELEQCLNEWLSTEENRWFEPATSVVLQNVKNQRHLEITLGFGHNGTWQDWGLRCARKTAFHAAVQYYCRQLGIIDGCEPPRPIVCGDADTMTHVPSSPGLCGGEPVAPVEHTKSSLGFLPPDARRLARRGGLRKRKTKGRKSVLRSMDS
ncbi:hypothetical protein BDZ89DRAFT_18077 [Hymenopellis radicata]|nr:hypothetical protein BDZ89DRAFT_18077 [Hymenopellis radicata]